MPMSHDTEQTIFSRLEELVGEVEAICRRFKQRGGNPNVPFCVTRVLWAHGFKGTVREKTLVQDALRRRAGATTYTVVSPPLNIPESLLFSPTAEHCAS